MSNRSGERNKLFVFATLLFALAIMACDSSFDNGGLDSRGSISINVSTDMLKGKSLSPGIDLQVTSYDIAGTGPASETFSVPGFSGSSLSLDNLRAGSWTISIQGKNAAGIAIVAASETVAVVANTVTTKNITCLPISGDGSLYLVVSWPVGSIAVPDILATATPLAGGTPVSLAFSISGSFASCNKSLPRGYYSLSITLNENQGSPKTMWGKEESAQILAGFTTAGTWELFSNDLRLDAKGGIAFALSSDSQAELPVAISGLSPSLISGASFSLAATATPGADTWQWYLNGAPLSGATNASLTFGSDLALGPYRIDVIANKGASAGSAGGSFRVVDASAGNITKVIAGNNVTYLIAQNGDLWTVGYNGYGQLGDGTQVSQTIPEKVMTGVANAAIGANHAMVLKTDGTVWTFGSNYSGQLGDGTTATRYTPTQVMSGVTAISAGSAHSLALKSDGSLYSFGDNSYGQLGDGSGQYQTSPVQILANVKSIEASSASSFAIKNDGTLLAFGNNSSGQLGDGTSTQRNTPVVIALSGVKEVSSSGAHTLFLLDNGCLMACGYNYYGELNFPPAYYGGDANRRPTPFSIMDSVIDMRATQYQSFCVTAEGGVWACGENDSRYGTGSTGSEKWYGFTKIMTKATGIAASDYHVIIGCTDGTLWSFGDNNYGQLCDNTTTRRQLPVMLQIP